YIVLEVDQARKEAVLEQLEGDRQAAKEERQVEAESGIERIKDQLGTDLAAIKEQVKDEETRELKKQAAELKAKQAVAQIKDALQTDMGNTDEVYDAVRELVKKVQTNSILFEDEYLKLVEYDAADHLTISMGAEALI